MMQWRCNSLKKLRPKKFGKKEFGRSADMRKRPLQNVLCPTLISRSVAEIDGAAQK